MVMSDGHDHVQAVGSVHAGCMDDGRWHAECPQWDVCTEDMAWCGSVVEGAGEDDQGLSAGDVRWCAG